MSGRRRQRRRGWVRGGEGGILSGIEWGGGVDMGGVGVGRRGKHGWGWGGGEGLTWVGFGWGGQVVCNVSWQ